MIRAALYARYSSDRQNERSIEDQLAQCSRLAGARGWVVVASFADAAISGAAMANRPGLNAALEAAGRREFDVLLTEDEDRIARNLEHQAHVFNRLRDLGVSIATMSSESIGIMEVGLKGLMAELYLANLSQKTSRGMRSNAEKGLATGSRLFGYRSEPGGTMTIVEEQAAVIREISRRYADGETARRIAADLNKRGVRGPRGGMWNASSINGSRQRGNGIVRTELYAGVKVWNRMVVVKDRATGRRTPKMKPESEWKRSLVPALRIIDEATWSAIQARHEREEGVRPEKLQSRRRGLFSGLLKCRCGASYTVYSGGRLMCAAHRERGDTACANSRTVSRAEVEARVLYGLKEKLLAPDLVEAYVSAYRQRMAANKASAADRRRPIERRLAEVERRIERGVEAILDGTATDRIKASLKALEAEAAELKAQLAEEDARDAAPTVELHPQAPAQYRRRIEQLQAALDKATAEDLDSAGDLVEVVRGLVIGIEIRPNPAWPKGPVEINVVGDLARFLKPAATEPNENRCGWASVAGASYSRSPTSLPCGFAA